MKSLFRSFLINLLALWTTSHILPALEISGGVKGLVVGALAFMVANAILVPLIRILLLPLNLITLGFFAWLANVLAFYILVNIVPYFKVLPYYFPGISDNGFTVPAVDLAAFQVVVVASLIIGIIIHFVSWLAK